MNHGPDAVTPTVDLHVILARRPSPSVEWVEAGDEVVVWHEASESLHLLDPNASVVFLLCDGETPLRQTIAEMSEAYGVSVDTMGADVTRLVSQLMELGVLTEMAAAEENDAVPAQPS